MVVTPYNAPEASLLCRKVSVRRDRDRKEPEYCWFARYRHLCHQWWHWRLDYKIPQLLFMLSGLFSFRFLYLSMLAIPLLNHGSTGDPTSVCSFYLPNIFLLTYWQFFSSVQTKPITAVLVDSYTLDLANGLQQGLERRGYRENNTFNAKLIGYILLIYFLNLK